MVPKLDGRRQVSTPPQVRPWLAGHAVRRAHLSPVDMAGGRRPCQIVHDLEVRQELGRRAKVPCAASCRLRRTARLPFMIAPNPARLHAQSQREDVRAHAQRFQSPSGADLLRSTLPVATAATPDPVTRPITVS